MQFGLKKTLSDSAIYGLSNFAQKAIGFLMLPIYTRHLTPSDYGTVSMMQILLDVVSLFFGMQIETAVFRHYYKARNQEERHRVISSALWFSLALKTLGAGMLMVFSGAAATLMFGDASLSTLIAVFAIAVVTESLTFIPFQYIRIQQRPTLYALASIAKLLTQFGLNIVFIVVLDYGVWGVVASSVISGVIVGSVLSIWLLSRIGYYFSLEVARSLVNYSWPLILSGVVGIYLGAGNRIALTQYWGLAEVGILALASQFSSILRSLVWAPFNQGWGAIRFEVATGPDAQRIFDQNFKLVLIALVFSGGAISILAKDIIAVMAAPAFYGAARVVPIMVLSEVILCFTLFASTPLMLKDKTIEMLYSSIIGAVVATVTLFTVVPKYSVMGAAGGALLSSFAGLCWVVVRSKGMLDVRLPWWRLTSAIIVALLFVTISHISSDVGVAAIIKKSLLIFGFALALYVSPTLSGGDREVIHSIISGWIRSRVRMIGQ